MSCTLVPVNMRDNTKQICKEECSFKYNYNANSSAIVTNMVDYLDIKVDGSNKVKFNSYTVNLKEVRLYQPSIHLFDGQQADAEITILHTGYGNNLLVCVPIKIADGKGKSNSFFNQIIEHVPPKTDSEEKTSQNINVSKWSLNDVVPNGTFYFYIGPLSYPKCDGKYNTIVFGLKDAAKINSSDLKILKTLTNPITYSVYQTLKSVAERKPILMINKEADGGGGAIGPNASNQDYYIFDQCEPIDGMPDDKKNEDPVNVVAWATFVMLLLGGLIIFALIYSFFGGVNSDSAGPTSQGVPLSPPSTK